ncbi:hypothetical protein C8R43DRAFT_1195282 [Mycena crocata]|nr:hypothetical protein C8R43DRAFT_1195282 [Mycena crocata]
MADENIFLSADGLNSQVKKRRSGLEVVKLHLRGRKLTFTPQRLLRNRVNQRPDSKFHRMSVERELECHRAEVNPSRASSRRSRKPPTSHSRQLDIIERFEKLDSKWTYGRQLSSVGKFDMEIRSGPYSSADQTTPTRFWNKLGGMKISGVRAQERTIGLLEAVSSAADTHHDPQTINQTHKIFMPLTFPYSTSYPLFVVTKDWQSFGASILLRVALILRKWLDLMQDARTLTLTAHNRVFRLLNDKSGQIGKVLLKITEAKDYECYIYVTHRSNDRSQLLRAARAWLNFLHNETVERAEFPPVLGPRDFTEIVFASGRPYNLSALQFAQLPGGGKRSMRSSLHTIDQSGCHARQSLIVDGFLIYGSFQRLQGPFAEVVQPANAEPNSSSTRPDSEAERLLKSRLGSHPHLCVLLHFPLVPMAEFESLSSEHRRIGHYWERLLSKFTNFASLFRRKRPGSSRSVRSFIVRTLICVLTVRASLWGFLPGDSANSNYEPFCLLLADHWMGQPRRIRASGVVKSSRTIIHGHQYTPSILPLAYPPDVSIASATVQLFFAWRIYALKGQLSVIYRGITALIVMVALMQSFAAIISDSRFAVTTDVNEIPKLILGVRVWLIGSAVCDVIITVTMLVILTGMKKSVPWTKTSTLIEKLQYNIIQTGAITSIVAILDVTLFLVFPANNFHQTPAFMLGKLYSNVLVVTLNARAVTGTPSVLAVNRTGPGEDTGINWRRNTTNGESMPMGPQKIRIDTETQITSDSGKYPPPGNHSTYLV